MLEFLRAAGLAAAHESPPAVALTGGVSSDIWKVALRTGTICVKRALPQLRVAQLWEAPVERNAFERRWLETANDIVPGLAPRVLAASDAGLFAMEYCDGMPTWKDQLRDGRIDTAFAGLVGAQLARVHGATADDAAIAAQFATDAGFHAIRLEPYLLATGRAHPALAPRLQALAERTASMRRVLVHGDVSPKNILVGPHGPLFLDAECAWFGDPAFDPAFCLNHLLLKALWKSARKDGYLDCFSALAQAYLAGADWEPRAALEARIAALVPGLLLARVDGKSPVEYLTGAAEKDFVRRTARSLLEHPPATLAEVAARWRRS